MSEKRHLNCENATFWTGKTTKLHNGPMGEIPRVDTEIACLACPGPPETSPLPMPVAHVVGILGPTYPQPLLRLADGQR